MKRIHTESIFVFAVLALLIAPSFAVAGNSGCGAKGCTDEVTFPYSGFQLFSGDPGRWGDPQTYTSYIVADMFAHSNSTYNDYGDGCWNNTSCYSPDIWGDTYWTSTPPAHSPYYTEMTAQRVCQDIVLAQTGGISDMGVRPSKATAYTYDSYDDPIEAALFDGSTWRLLSQRRKYDEFLSGSSGSGGHQSAHRIDNLTCVSPQKPVQTLTLDSPSIAAGGSTTLHFNNNDFFAIAKQTCALSMTSQVSGYNPVSDSGNALVQLPAKTGVPNCGPDGILSVDTKQGDPGQTSPLSNVGSYRYLCTDASAGQDAIDWIDYTGYSAPPNCTFLGVVQDCASYGGQNPAAAILAINIGGKGACTKYVDVGARFRCTMPPSHGDISVSPSQTTAYTYSCTNVNGTTNQTATLAVTPTRCTDGTVIGASCTGPVSTANSCGQTTPGTPGTITSCGVCSAATPPVPPTDASCPAPTVACSVNPPSGTAGTTSFTWSATPSGGTTTGYTYSWSGTDSLSGSIQNLSKTYASPGIKSATVTVTDSVGHTSAATSCSGTASVSENGVCSATHYTCTSSTASTDQVSGTTSYTWTCPGANGGTSASCGESKPVNGPSCTLSNSSGSTLSWTASNATTAAIDQGIGAVTPVSSGTYTVSNVPSGTTLYTMTVKNASGSQGTCQAQISGPCSGGCCGGSCPPVGGASISCTRSPSGSTLSAPATVTYTAVPSVSPAATTPFTFRDALSSLLQSTSAVTYTTTYNPAADTAYAVSVSAGNVTTPVACGTALTVTGSGGGCGSTPTGGITASPNRVQSGAPTHLTWNASGVATSCTLSGPGLTPITTSKDATCAVAGPGADPVVTTQSTYTLTCNGTVVDQVTVNVLPSFVEF